MKRIMPFVMIFLMLIMLTFLSRPLLADHQDARKIADALADCFSGDLYIDSFSFDLSDQRIAGPGDWEYRKLQPYLYHIRRKAWKDFYWLVNTARRSVFKITGGSYGKTGGNYLPTNMIVRPVAPDQGDNLDRFVLEIPDGALLCDRKKAYIYGQNAFLAEWDLQVKEMKPYLYHIRTQLIPETGWYWKVNTSRKEVYLVTGGRFGEYGGQEKPVPEITLKVFGNPENPNTFRLYFARSFLNFNG